MTNYNTWKKEFFEDLRNERTTYKDMINFCCDSLILNNTLIETLIDNGFYFDEYTGVQYDEERGEYIEIYQYFIIDSGAAERLAEFTNELVLYNDDLDLYFLCVSHYGTCWDCVPANWKNIDDIIRED